MQALVARAVLCAHRALRASLLNGLLALCGSCEGLRLSLERPPAVAAAMLALMTASGMR